MSKEGSGSSYRERVKGLLVFSQENGINRKPIIDQAALKVSFQRETKVMLHHLSALD